MGESIKPVEGLPHEVLAKQEYKSNLISHSMFTSSDRDKDRKVMIPPTKLSGVTIEQLWNGIFAGSSNFLSSYHERRNEKDFEAGKWDMASNLSNGFRTMSLQTIVEVPRAGTYTLLQEAHRFAYTKKADGTLLLIYQISSQTPQVPAGTSFRPEAMFAITAPSESADCTITIYGNVRKMSMAFVGIQYIAVPRALKDMTAAYKMMVEMMSEKLMNGEKLTVAEVGAADGGDGGAVGGGDSVGGSSRGGGGETSNIVFQALVLLLATIIALSIMWSISTLKGTAYQASIMNALSRQDVCRNCGKWAAGMANGGDPGATDGGDGVEARVLASVTQDQALRNAAREAQIQSLRYRWMEQRLMIASLEGSVSWLWWLVIAQSLVIAGVVGKLFWG